MNLELLAAVLALAVLSACYLAVKLWPITNNSDKFVWQPDLSHKVVILESPPVHSRSTEQVVVLVEKTPEERAEERRAYLKENRK